MANVINIKAVLADVAGSARRVELLSRRESWIVFDDPRAWELFGDVQGVLKPCDRYSYEWTLAALESVNKQLQTSDDLNRYEPDEEIEQLVAVDKNELLAWVDAKTQNARYVIDAFRRYADFLDAKGILKEAQRLAMSSLWHDVVATVQNLLRESRDREASRAREARVDDRGRARSRRAPAKTKVALGALSRMKETEARV